MSKKEETTPEALVLHENERYVVLYDDRGFEDSVRYQGSEYRYGYEVVNRETGVTEMRTPVLPDAIMVAEQMDASMQAEMWTYIRPPKVNPDGTPVEALVIEEDDPEVH